MRSALIGTSVWVAARFLTAAVLAFIGLLVGAGCVIFPQALPWAILGIAGLLLLWVMPNLRTVPERLAARMLIPFIVSILSVPAYYAIILPGLPWISIRRLVYAIFAGAVAITLAGSSTKRAEVASRLRAAPLIVSLLLAYYAINLLATLTSSSISTSSNDFLLNVLYGFMPFIAIVLIVVNEKQLRLIFVSLVVCAFINFVLGSIETIIHRPFLIYAIPGDMRARLVAQFAGYSALITPRSARGGMYRALSIYTTALSWGEMAAMISPFAAFFAAFGRKSYVKVLGFIAIGVCLASVFLTGSRGGYVGLIAAAILFWIVLVIRMLRSRPQSLAGPIALCICLVLALSTVSSVLFVGRIHRAVLGGSETQSSTDARYEQWALAKPKILARPVLGYGPGTSASVVGWTSLGGDLSLDSFVVTLLVGVGIPGCAAFFGMLAASMLKCFQSGFQWASPLGSYALSLGCSIFAYTLYRTTLSQTENNSLMFVLIGLIVSISAMARRNPTTSPPSYRASLASNIR